MFKKFIMRQAMKSQLKDVPETEREMLLDAVERNPAFFENLAKELEDGLKSGKDQRTVMMDVMQKHQAELARLMQKSQ